MFLKMMKCELISLLVFQTAAVNVNINNFELEYFVTYENWCKSDKDRFQFIIGISIEQCVVECGARGHCRSHNYRNQINGCELFLTSETEQPIPGECVYVKKDNINVTKSPCQDGCAYGQVCESTRSQGGMCKIKECINTKVPKNGAVLGNLRGVGNRIRYMCNPGYEAKNDSQIPVAECLDNGNWSHVTECVKTNYTWASWSPWSTCSLSCESGSQSRTRECSLRTEGNGASYCDKGDVDVENSTCNEQSCPTPTHGMSCSSKTDCIETEGVCIEGICFCHHLFEYNKTINNCTKVCDIMTGNYKKVDGVAIDGFNTGTEYDSLEDCKKACNDKPICLSFEIWQDGKKFKCATGLATYDMINSVDPTKLKPFSDYEVYSKTCS